MLKRIINILAFLLTTACLEANAQETVNPAFRHGEKLKYVLSYKVGFINAEVAYVDFNTTLIQYNGKNIFNVDAFSTIVPSYKAFFDINDRYVSKLYKETLLPYELVAELQEGRYRFSSRYDYVWDSMLVHTRARNHKNPDYTHRTLQLIENSFDGLAFLYNMRSRDLRALKGGEQFIVNLVLEDTIRPIHYRFEKREVKEIKEHGRFNTLKFVCKLATSQGETFEDGSELFIWLSDDENKIPIFMETPIRIGTVRASLLKYSGLKYPLSSKLR